MKIVLFSGNASNQMALANKIHDAFKLEAIVVVNKSQKYKWNLKIIIDKVLSRILVSEITTSWNAMLKFFHNQFNSWPSIYKLEVFNINNQNVIDLIKKNEPNLIIVSGTNLLKDKLLTELNPSIGILNLHTGLSPYVKGGPNCTNWCIANQDYHLIGNTVMWIDKGIDTGNIIFSEFTSFNNPKNLNDVQISVMKHAHELLLGTIKKIQQGEYNSEKQKDIALGKTYYTKNWTIKKQLNLKRNLPFFINNINSPLIVNNRNDIITINLEK